MRLALHDSKKRGLWDTMADKYVYLKNKLGGVIINASKYLNDIVNKILFIVVGNKHTLLFFLRFLFIIFVKNFIFSSRKRRYDDL